MKYLKTYENFDEQDLGRFGQEEMDINNPENNIQSFNDDEFNDDEFNDDEFNDDDFEEEMEEDDENRYRTEDRKLWGDERMVESRKRFDKKDKCGPNCKCKKEDKCGPNCKCKDDKEKGKEKGLTAAQKKLPEGLRRAIENRNKKRG